MTVQARTYASDALRS